MEVLKMSALRKILVITILSLSWQAIAAIQVMIIQITDTETYTVPEGKVLLIDKIPDMSGDLIVSNGTVSVQLTSMYMYEWSPIRIPGNWNLRSSTTNGLFIFGRLADPSDLYASLESRTENIMVADNTFSFDLISASSRPAKVSILGSTDLKSPWQPTSASIERTDSTAYRISIPVTDQNQYFAKCTLKETGP